MDDLKQMSVAEVRRTLAYIRKSWEDQTSNITRPFYLSDAIGAGPNAGLSVESFALSFVLAHHSRRLHVRSTDECQVALSPV